MVDFVHGCSAVHNVRLNRLLIDDWLHMLMDVVVNMFPLSSWCLGLSASGRANFAGVLCQTKPSLLLRQNTVDTVMVSVAKLFVLGILVYMSMLLREDLSVLDGLDSGVVMILMNFLVHWSVNLLVLSGLHMLMLNGGFDVLFSSWSLVKYSSHRGYALSYLLDLGLVVTIPGQVLEDCGFCCFHVDSVVVIDIKCAIDKIVVLFGLLNG